MTLPASRSSRDPRARSTAEMPRRGVINIITNEPRPELGGELTVAAGNYDLKRVQGAVNIPLQPNLAVRAAFNIVDRDGYLQDGFDDDEQQSARVRLGWQPTEDLNVGFKLDYTHIGGMGQSSVVFPTPPGVDPWMAASGPTVRSYQVAANAPPVPADGFVDNEYASASGQLDADFGFAQLTVISGLSLAAVIVLYLARGHAELRGAGSCASGEPRSTARAQHRHAEARWRCVLVQRRHELQSAGLSGCARGCDRGPVQYLHALSRAHRCRGRFRRREPVADFALSCPRRCSLYG